MSEPSGIDEREAHLHLSDALLDVCEAFVRDSVGREMYTAVDLYATSTRNERRGAFAAALAAHDAEVAERIAAAIEAAGRAEVCWLAEHASDTIDRARLIGAEDAWKAALAIACKAAR